MRSGPTWIWTVLLAALAVLAVSTAATGAVRTSAGTAPGGGAGSENGTLVLSVSPTSAQVAVDGASVPLDANGSALLALAPGTYAVTAQASGDQPFRGNATVYSNESSYLTIHLPPTAGSSGGAGAAQYLTAPVVATIVGAVVIVVLGVVLLRPASRNAPPEPEPAASSPAPPSDEGPP